MIIYIALIIIIFLVLFNQRTENMSTDEAIKNLASLYNAKKLKTTDLEATGDVNVTGGVKAGKVNVDGTMFVDGDKKAVWMKELGVGGNLHVTGDITKKWKPLHCQIVGIPNDKYLHEGYSGQPNMADWANQSKWVGVECPEGYFLTGIKRTGTPHQQYFRGKYAAKCCTFK